LNNGASVVGNIVDNGTLQFNQSLGHTLTINSTISGTGALSLTNEGTLNLTGTTSGAGFADAVNLYTLEVSASAGLLQICSGTGNLRVGALSVAGGSVTNTNGLIGAAGVYGAFSGTATVSSGSWANHFVLETMAAARRMAQGDGGTIG
jgi:hypothetical protein